MSRSVVRCTLVLFLGLFAIPGCGLETYEHRLAETNEYFKYINKLDTYLSDVTWSNPAYGVELRYPKGFVEMAGPAPPAEGEDPESPVVDPRQPDFLGVDLPGLIAAFRADDGQSVALLYLLGNHERILIRAANDGVGDDPATFLVDLELLLQNAIGVTIPDQPGKGDHDNEKYAETIPREGKYAVQKEFTAISFLQAESRDGAGSTPELRLQLYEHQAGSMQVAILMVFRPKLARTDPREALRLSLETLKVSSEPPRLKNPSQAESSGNAPSF
jgi:hypothetical protein